MFRQISPMLALFAGMAFLMMGGGLHGILIPIRGQIEGFSSFQLGWIGTGWAVGFTIGCILIPHLVRRAGHVRTFSTLTALLSASVLMNAMFVDAGFWILLRALSGFCFAGCYMVAESWLNERVTNEQRGSMFSFYQIITLLAMAGGQYLLVIAEPERETLFMVAAILFALAVVPTAVSSAQSPAPLTHVSLDLPALFRNSPAAVVAAFLSGSIASAWTIFGPVFGQKVGLSTTLIATMLSAALLGSILFQYPLGKLSDKIDRRFVMVLAGIIGAAAGTIMTMLAKDGTYGPLFYAAVVLYGGVIYSIYSLAVAHANDYADADDFVKIASGLLLVYGFGTMVGPLFTAQLMDILGPSGIFTFTTIAHTLFAAYALYRWFRRSQASEEDRVDFQTVGLARATTPESYNLDPRANPDAVPTDKDQENQLPPMPPPVKVEKE